MAGRREGGFADVKSVKYAESVDKCCVLFSLLAILRIFHLASFALLLFRKKEENLKKKKTSGQTDKCIGEISIISAAQSRLRPDRLSTQDVQ